MSVVTQHPLQAMFKIANFTGRISKWGAKLGALDVHYLLRTTIKGEVLADFVAKFTPPPPGEGALNLPTTDRSLIDDSIWWKIYVDKASNAKRAEAGVVIITPEGSLIEKSIRLDFQASNNKAVYEAVLAGQNSAKILGARNLQLHCDFQLVTNQLSGDYMASDERMTPYLSKTQEIIGDFDKVEITQIGRNLNSCVDALATLTSVLSADLKRHISIDAIKSPSIDKHASHIHSITVNPCWIVPYIFFLKDGTLPQDKKEVVGIRRKASKFWLSKDLRLYKRSFFRTIPPMCSPRPRTRPVV
jgi:ribonuclease HI